MCSKVFVGILGAVLATTPVWAQRHHVPQLPGIGSVASDMPVGGPGSVVGLRGRDFSATPNHRTLVVPGPPLRHPERRDFSHHRRGTIVGFGTPVYPYYPVVTDSADTALSEEAQRNDHLQQQLDDLNYEVRRLREEREQHSERSSLTPPAPPEPATTPASSASTDATPSDPTAIIFRDGKTEQVRNYAIIGTTLWIFGDHQTRKVPLSEIDIPATEKANDEQGIPFKVPVSAR